MPGIFGIIGKNATAEIFTSMQRTARLQDWYKTETFEGEGLFLGVSGLPEQHLIHVVDDSENQYVLFFYGEIFNARELDKHYRKAREVSLAQVLRDGFLAEGKLFLDRLEGRFQAVLWNCQTRQAMIFTDVFATRPLYWAVADETLVFASEIKTLLAYPGVERTLNPEALVDFFTWGHYFHTHTSVQGVNILPPAAWYLFSASDGVLTKGEYYAFPPTQYESGDDDVETVARYFRDAVHLQTRQTPHLGISLSGGLDARSILGMIPPFQLPEVLSVALGVPGSADHRLATQLAKLAGTQHHNYELNTQFLQNYSANLAEMVRLTDGQYLSASIVIPTLPFYRELGIRTLLRGHAGELFHMSKAYAFSLPEQDLRMFSGPQSATRRTALTNWAFQHLQAYMLNGVQTDLFAKISRADAHDMARASLEKALLDAGLEQHDNVAQTLWFLYLKQRVFREIPLSMRKFDSQVNVRLPILDRPLMEFLLPLPPELKMAETIQRRTLQMFRSDFLGVKNVNTGTYIGSNPLRQKLAGLKHKILAKLRFPGYQPYEKMGLWLRRELAPVVSGLLLEGDFLDRGIFHADTVRSVIQTHNEGQNHTYLILALMICEMQFRHLGVA